MTRCRSVYVIMPACKAALGFEYYLEAICSERFDYEVLVVGSDVSDGPLDVVRKYSDKVLSVSRLELYHGVRETWVSPRRGEYLWP